DTPDYTGDIFLNGEKYHAKSTTAALKKRIAYVPSNRKENAIIPDLSVKTNGTLATLKRYCKFFLLQNAPQHDDFATHAADFHIKYADENDLITTLSGGNQQKVILARWINTKPQVLILDNPTQGVDIGAKQEIYEIVKKIAQSGVAIIVLSGEGQEIVRLCERTLVMFHGKIAGELSGDALNEQEIMKLATGANLI
ncbi:MAG: sugar ABC transporter ATP-binding protein, partial [Victivallales bacterium]|nr:sugar ABC transporter ATP-binding protein [Victivallales bacterium]